MVTTCTELGVRGRGRDWRGLCNISGAAHVVAVVVTALIVTVVPAGPGRCPSRAGDLLLLLLLLLLL